MVSVDQPGSVLDPAMVARAHRAIEPLHSHLYFALSSTTSGSAGSA